MWSTIYWYNGKIFIPVIRGALYSRNMEYHILIFDNSFILILWNILLVYPRNIEYHNMCAMESLYIGNMQYTIFQKYGVPYVHALETLFIWGINCTRNVGYKKGQIAVVQVSFTEIFSVQLYTVML